MPRHIEIVSKEFRGHHWQNCQRHFGIAIEVAGLDNERGSATEKQHCALDLVRLENGARSICEAGTCNPKLSNEFAEQP